MSALRGTARALAAAAVVALVAVACSSRSPTSGFAGDASVGAPDGLIDSPTSDDSGVGPPGPVDSSVGEDGEAGEGSAGCGQFAGDQNFTCSADGNSRGECSDDASLIDEACPNGCLREPSGQDSICMGTTDTWSCTGSYGTTKALDGNYYLTEFGCWEDDAGVHTDPDDNCIPSCLQQAQQAGLCDPNGTGADCEEKLDWYTADGARFGCLQRLRVTNPANGLAVIAIALDFGPSCTGEATVQHAVLDASGVINDYLYGGAEGASDMALVHVVEVDDSYPLGPTN